MTSLLVVNAAAVVTPQGRGPQAGERQGAVVELPGAVVRCEAGAIVFVGDRDAHDRRFGAAATTLDAGGGAIIPGFVDPHTHLPFAGYREGEFDRRLRGETYAEIAASGAASCRPWPQLVPPPRPNSSS